MNTPRSRSTPDPAPVDRPSRLAERIAVVGIPKQELALKAGIDRGTLSRALKGDPRISERTWTVLERTMSRLEDEIGVSDPSTPPLADASQVTSTVEYGGATITLQGKAEAVAEAIRRVLEG